MEKRACLIFHGFGGGIEEIEYLKQYLLKEKHDVHTVQLSGHGGTKKELAASRYLDWIRSAREALRELSSSYDAITLIGFSMGGLICTQLVDEPKVEKIVFVNTPVFYWNFKVILKTILHDIRNRQSEMIRYYIQAVRAIPLVSAIQFHILLKKAKPLFRKINCPVLILQCKEDESVKAKSALYIKKQIPNNAVLKIYQGGCHQVFFRENNCRPDYCKDISEFLK